MARAANSQLYTQGETKTVPDIFKINSQLKFYFGYHFQFSVLTTSPA